MELQNVPSAFQIRIGGEKGVLTVMPDDFLPNDFIDIDKIPVYN